MTDIVCKCGASRLEDIQCAECGQYFRVVHPPETLDEAMHELKRALDDVFMFMPKPKEVE